MNFDYIYSVALLSDCDGKMSSRGVGQRERERRDQLLGCGRDSCSRRLVPILPFTTPFPLQVKVPVELS